MALDLLVWSGDGALRTGGSAPLFVVAAAVTVFLVLSRLGGRLGLAYAVAVLFTVAMTLLVPAYEPFTAVFLVLYRIVRTRPPRKALLYVVGTAVPWSANIWNASQIESGMDVRGIALAAVIWSVMTGLIWMAARYAANLEQLALAREDAATARGLLALQDERVRLARDLHDVLSHSVSAIVLQAAGAQRIMGAGAAQSRSVRQRDALVLGALGNIESASGRALQDMREMLALLAPSETAAQASGLVGPDLSSLIETTRACDVEVVLEERGLKRPLDPARETAAYRTVQEALTNVIRHAGPGSTARIGMSWLDSELEITVVNTRGREQLNEPVGGRSGRGLDGLRGRLAAFEGTLDVGPVSDGGYHVRATIPYAHSSAPPERAREVVGGHIPWGAR